MSTLYKASQLEKKKIKKKIPQSKNLHISNIFYLSCKTGDDVEKAKEQMTKEYGVGDSTGITNDSSSVDVVWQRNGRCY